MTAIDNTSDLQERNNELAEEIEEATRLKKEWAKKAMEAASARIELQRQIERLRDALQMVFNDPMFQELDFPVKEKVEKSLNIKL